VVHERGDLRVADTLEMRQLLLAEVKVTVRLFALCPLVVLTPDREACWASAFAARLPPASNALLTAAAVASLKNLDKYMVVGNPRARLNKSVRKHGTDALSCQLSP
jgi:hypothetical protein